LSGLATAYWKNIDDLSKQWQIDRTFVPVIDHELTGSLIKGWKRAVKAAEAWAKE